MTDDFIPKTYPRSIDSGTVECTAPSNIALVKYWGKKDDQIPANPSISFTLDHCKTETKIAFEKRSPNHDFSFDLLFEGEPKDDFKPKISKFFERTERYLPFLKDYHFTIDTRNTFPHSSGIASSASGMAALAVNLMGMERMLDPEMGDDFFYRKASFLARLGSGSACRSVKGKVVVWGAHGNTPGSSDLYGVEFPGKLHSVYDDFCDTILLVDRGEKKVSSTVGHDLMFGHAFATTRFAQAHENLDRVSKVLGNGDLETFITTVESEALTLHAMMMTSVPYFVLMKPNTLEILNRIWTFRSDTKIPVCFTLDAGANVHVLYPRNAKQSVMQFVEKELVAFCQNGQFIEDRIGNGAQIF